MRLLRRLTLAGLALGSLAACDKLKKQETSNAPVEQATQPIAGCAVPQDAVVRKDLVFPAGCKLSFPEGLTIEDGATLTIGAGSRLAFGASRLLHVLKGKLVARGTDKEPITFTSSSPTPAPGDWVGFAYSADAAAGNVLERVVVEYAGNANRFGTGVEAALAINGPQPGRLSITSSTFRKNKGAAIDASAEPAVFAKLDGNTLQDGAYSLHVQGNVLGSIGATNKLEKPVRVEGAVLSTQSWPKLEVPIVVAGLQVGGEKGDSVLTLAPGTTLKMEAGAQIFVGVHGSGGLVAKNAVFTSATASPAAGDWTGVAFGAKTSTASLDGAIFEHAGRPWSAGHVAVLDVDPAIGIGKQLKIANTTFRKNGAPSILSATCAEASKPEAGNKSEGAAMCAAH